jgi:SET domain-containing protein
MENVDTQTLVSRSEPSGEKAPEFNPNERFEKNEYLQPKKIVVKMSDPQMGLGVFATENIEAGEIVERCPMIQMTWRSKYHGDSQISKYLYSDKSCDCMQCKIHGHHMFMVLGYGMIYNHQDEPNTEWKFNWQNLVADVIALKPIKAGQEIFVHYGSSYFNSRSKVTVSEDSSSNQA